MRFQQNYLHEGLPSATASLRMHAHELGRCTLCHACDDVCPLLRTLPSAEFTGPMGFVVAGARSATHLADVEGTLRLMVGDDCRACRACARACPEGIPILRLAELLLGQHAAIEGARVRALQQPTSI